MPLEDELGDVLEKAMRHSRLDEETLAARTGIPSGKILDAIDYRPDLSCDEIRRLAEALGLNEVGLCAMGAGRYPLPRIGALPFCVWPLRMPHGIGVANAYLVAESGSSRAVLFDTGAGMGTLVSVWPSTIRHVEAVFLTHVEGEHAGGLAEVVERFDVPTIFIPRGAAAPGASNMGEGETRSFGALEVTAFTTPGHAAAHNCYLVRMRGKTTEALLVSGDLVFAGSAGGAFFSLEQQQLHVQRMLRTVPPATVIAPGHGPMTTVENELRYNPFIV